MTSRDQPARERAESSAAAARVRVSPFCVQLGSKKILGLSGRPLTKSDVLDGSNWCWCSRTGQILGPDREPAHPDDCVKGRACFESPWSELL
ncbi:MAG: hypothetical protein H6825_10295 [Planctomycetes bacterium]|nr:hypothetical protein [Planctomycetota bacterium]